MSMEFEAAARAMQVYEDHATPVDILTSLSQQVLLFIQWFGSADDVC